MRKSTKHLISLIFLLLSYACSILIVTDAFFQHRENGIYLVDNDTQPPYLFIIGLSCVVITSFLLGIELTLYHYDEDELIIEVDDNGQTKEKGFITRFV